MLGSSEWSIHEILDSCIFDCVCICMCIEFPENREIVKWRWTELCCTASSTRGKPLKHCVSLSVSAPTLPPNYRSESTYHVSGCWLRSYVWFCLRLSTHSKYVNKYNCVIVHQKPAKLALSATLTSITAASDCQIVSGQNFRRSVWGRNRCLPTARFWQKESFKTRVENAIRNVNNRSRIRASSISQSIRNI